MAGPSEKDKPGTSEERTTERRMVTASAVMQAATEASRDVASEDFLFHLYRGSELLQDNRVHEAKEELEQALTLQPRDPKGQDLLAVVYFRIGLYPLAIQIYEQLKRDNPRDASIKLNLALGYLKTGQAQAACAELEDVVRLHPAHKRAWGYLGLAYERLNELAKAQTAFERGGHAQMARRLGEKIDSAHKPPSLRGDAASEEVRGAAAAAFEELDAGEISFSLAEPATGSSQSGTWRTTEPGAVPSSRSHVPAPQALGGWTIPPSAEATSIRADEAASRPDVATPFPAPPSTPGAQAVPMPLAHLTRALRLVFPQTAGVLLHPSGIALVRTTSAAPARPFASRLEAIRVHQGSLTTEALPRQTRGKSTGEPFGGVASPLVCVSGAGELVVAPRPSHTILPFAIADETVTLREDVLLGFDLAPIAYEHGKLPLGDGESVHIVQLRGTGVVLLELLEGMHALEVTAARPALVRRDSLVGWTGSVAPRALPAADAPSGQRGLLRLEGEGTALLTSG
jgi:Tfp pilus assembly protein PilF